MNGPWILVALLLVFVVLVAIAFALSLRLVNERRSTSHVTPYRNRRPDGQTNESFASESFASISPPRSSGLVASPKGMKLINEYGAVAELYAGYSAGVSERVLPAHLDAIEAALTSAIMANPTSKDRVALEMGIMSLADFLPDPDGSRGMELHESITRQGLGGTVEVDPSKHVHLLMDEEDGDDFLRLTQLVASRSSEKLAIVERLQRTHPGRQSQAGRLSDGAVVSPMSHATSQASGPRVPIRSSNIASVGYDSPSLTLQVEFRDGALYEYDGVPRRVYDDLLASPSAGSYFHRAVKGAYRYRRIG